MGICMFVRQPTVSSLSPQQFTRTPTSMEGPPTVIGEEKMINLNYLPPRVIISSNLASTITCSLQSATLAEFIVCLHYLAEPLLTRGLEVLSASLAEAFLRSSLTH